MSLTDSQKRWLFWLLLIGFGTFIVRLLAHWNLQNTSLLYVGAPWLLALLITAFTRASETESWSSGITATLRAGLIIMLGSSVVLGEGFICVIFFLPIFLLVVAVVYVFSYLSYRRDLREANKRSPVHLAPLLIGLLALEGVTPALSFEREGSVTMTRTTPQTAAQIMANLAQPVELKNTTSSGLSRIFPQPYQVDTGEFKTGAVHLVHYRYHRWLWGNTSEGTLKLQMKSVQDDRVETRVIENDSYLANYLDLEGSTISLKPSKAQAGATEVSLSIRYRRTLDPAWYFSPLLKIALSQAGEHMLDQIILRTPPPLSTDTSLSPL